MPFQSLTDINSLIEEVNMLHQCFFGDKKTLRSDHFESGFIMVLPRIKG
jgi:hypothetical protein